MSRPKEIRLGLWGTSRSGKTTFMAMLYFAFLEHPDWDIQAESEDSQEFVETVREALYSDRRFHRKTVEEKSYVFRIHSKRDPEKYPSVTLEFSDLPGELYEAFYQRDKRDLPVAVHQSSMTEQTPLTPTRAFEHLTQVDGLLILIDPGWADPEAENRTYHQLLFQLFQELRTHRERTHQTKPMPLTALCLMKSDATLAHWRMAKDFHGERCKHRAPNALRQLECATECPIYQVIQPPFISQQIYGFIPHEQVRCFLASAVGRAASDQLNVGDNNLWKRNLTPDPPLPFQSTARDAAMVSRDPVLRTGQSTGAPLYYPTTITNPTELQPMGLIQPILWFIETLKA